MTPRQAIAESLASLAKGAGASVTNIMPLRPGENLQVEATPDAAASIASMLCDAGYDARPQGTIRRLVAHARREVTNYKLETGETAQRVETFPGEVDLTSVEVIIPADAGLRPSIPGPQRHHRNPAVHRRKATP